MVSGKLKWFKDADKNGDFIGKRRKAQGKTVTFEIEEEDDDPLGRGIR